MRAVNLIPSDQRSAVSAAGRSGGGAYGVLGILGGLAILAFMYGMATRQVSSRKAKAASLSARAQRADVAASALSPYTSFITMRNERLHAVSSLVDSRFDWAHALHELGRVLPRGASISSLDGTVGAAGAATSASSASSSSTASAGASGAAAAVTSATPPGAVPTFTVNGCATSQAEVALTLQRLRLIDGVSEVKLHSSTKSDAGPSAGGSVGSCAKSDPAFTLEISFHPLPTPAGSTAPSTSLASNAQSAGAGSSSTGAAR
jgi:hypothetical protein